MLSCEEVTRLVSESMDRRLPLSRRIPMRMHLRMCNLCAKYRRQLLMMRQAVRRYASEATADAGALSAGTVARIKDNLKKRGA
ncbi:MAG: hypothetical protein Kow0099_20610 [Candidatus Abyssubacteria bacterium]